MVGVVGVILEGNEGEFGKYGLALLPLAVVVISF